MAAPISLASPLVRSAIRRAGTEAAKELAKRELYRDQNGQLVVPALPRQFDSTGDLPL